MLELRAKLLEAVEYIGKRVDFKPELSMILGSGLGDLADEIEVAARFPFGEIPHFPVSTVAGHAGLLILGELEGKRVATLKGRIHYYEGYSMDQVTFPVRLFKALGAGRLLVTNACGGLRSDMHEGDLMLITDHINLMGANPLIGPNDAELGERFPDMSNAYDREMRALAIKVAAAEEIPLIQGVFSAV